MGHHPHRGAGTCAAVSFVASLPTEEVAEMLVAARSNVSLTDYLPEEIHMDACSVKISDFSREQL